MQARTISAAALFAATLLIAAMPVRAASPTPPAATPLAAEIAAAKGAMMGEPKAALAHAAAARNLAAAEPPGQAQVVDLATAQWLQAEALIRLQRPTEAAPIVEGALMRVAQTAPGTKLHGDLVKARGKVEAAVGQIQSALRDFQTAYVLYQRAQQPRGQAIALQEIGSIYSDARDYAHVLRYYAQSSEVFGQDPALNLAAHNNRGFALKDMNRLPEAAAEFSKALSEARLIGSPFLQAQILNNIAYVKVLSGDLRGADAALAQGLALARGDAEARSETPFLLGVSAESAARRGQSAEAVRLISQTFAGVDLAKSAMAYRDFHEIASRIYEKAGAADLALHHLQAFKRLDDQGRALAASTNAALMAAQFDFANQDLKIAKLKAGELQRDIAMARAKARSRAIFVGVLFAAGGAIFVVVLLAFLYMRRSRNEVRAANGKLGSANTALEKALRAKTEFLATTSHEIRTPLNGILGMTQIILADAAVGGALRDRVELVHGAGETMRVLVDDLLDVAKIETGALVVDPAPFDLHRTLDETVRFWSGQAQAKGLSLRLEASDAPRAVVEDEARLRQMLFNLMSNALKFTEKGGVVLSAHAEADHLVISVADTGIGIAAGDQEHIFVSFAQVDGGVTRKYGGTGLGLTICRNIARAMGGEVTVVSSPAQGAVFTLRLPLTRAPACAAPDDASPMRAATLAEARILVVESNLLTQSIIRAMLAPHAATVVAAATVAEAEAILATQPVDLILADGASAAIEGDAPAGVRRLDASAGRAAVAVLWPGADAEGLAALLRCGVDQVIAKPVGTADLVAALAGALLARTPPAATPAPLGALASAA